MPARFRALAPKVAVALSIVCTGVAGASHPTFSAVDRDPVIHAPIPTPTTPHRHRTRPHDLTDLATVFGVYAGPTDFTAVASVNSLLDHQVTYAMDFLDGSTWESISDPTWPVEQWEGKGYTMIWGVPIIPNSGGSLAAGAAGDYNQYFRRLGRFLVAHGQAHSIIRLGWEFNGGWFPWAANHHAHDFKEYFRKIVRSMRRAVGQDFQFEWNPTRGDLGVGNLKKYYPGNRYVDIIGDDVYDAEWGSYPGHRAEWQRMLTEPYGLDWLASFATAHGKPVAFPEWGLGWTSGGEVGGGDNPYFIRHMANWIADHHCVATTFWDYGTSTIVSKNPAVTTMIKQEFGS